MNEGRVGGLTAEIQEKCQDILNKRIVSFLDPGREQGRDRCIIALIPRTANEDIPFSIVLSVHVRLLPLAAFHFNGENGEGGF